MPERKGKRWKEEQGGGETQQGRQTDWPGRREKPSHAVGRNERIRERKDTKEGKREMVCVQMEKDMSSEMFDPVLSSALNKIAKTWESLQMK